MDSGVPSVTTFLVKWTPTLLAGLSSPTILLEVKHSMQLFSDSVIINRNCNSLTVLLLIFYLHALIMAQTFIFFCLL